MDILITGVAGFIGHATAMRLLRDGHTVYGIDKPRDLRADKGPRLDELERQEMFNLVHADLANYDEARAAIINLPFDVMIHLAGQYSVGYSSKNLQAFIDGNLRSYLHVMDIAREKGIKRVIYASSTFVQTNQLPWSMYGATLEFRERAANVYAEMGMETIGLRFGSTYGPNIRPDVGVYIIARKLFSGTPINVEEGGFKYPVSFLYIDDAVECIVQLLTTKLGSRHEVFTLVADEQGYDLGAVLELLEKHSDKVAIRIGSYATSMNGRRPSIDDLHKTIGYIPHTRMTDGIKKFVEWFARTY